MDLAEFTKRRSEIERLQRESSRGEGALQQLMRRIKDEFGCYSLEELEDYIERSSKKIKKLEAEYEKQQRLFDSKWKAKIESMSK